MRLLMLRHLDRLDLLLALHKVGGRAGKGWGQRLRQAGGLRVEQISLGGCRGCEVLHRLDLLLDLHKVGWSVSVAGKESKAADSS